MTIVRLLLMLSGAAGFIGLVMPLVRRRILNIGNAAGLAVCAALMLYALFMPRINLLIVKWWQRTIGKIILSVIGLGITVGVILVITITVCMIKSLSVSPASNATAIVLGCKVYGEQPSIILTERMECIYRYLVLNGISPDRIYMEDQSTSTRENFAFSYEIIKENSLPEEIAIVTNEFHEYRAGVIAGRLGLSYGAVPAKTAGWLLPTYYARELFGILYEWCKFS